MKNYQWLLVGVLLLGLLGIPNTETAADSTYFLSSVVDVHFGSSVDFELAVSASPMLEELWLFLQPEGADIILLEVPSNSFADPLQFSIDPNALALRAFGDVVYWYQAEFDGGVTLTSEQYRFTYLDDRFAWRALQTDHFRLYWYEGDLAFGTAAVNIAENSFDVLTSEFGDVYNQTVIDVFLYGSRSALQDTLSASAYGWVAGHADPELGQMLLSIAPGADQKTEMERQIPHELAHLFTYQVTGKNYTHQPIWLLEGIATNAELEPDPSYRSTLTSAAAEKRLIPLRDLCARFPAQGDEVYLAYAEAESFVRFLKENHGNDALQSLLAEYASGTACEAGFANVYGISLQQMESRWQKQELGVSPLLTLLGQMAPYFILLLMVVLLPLLLSLIRSKTPENSDHA